MGCSLTATHFWACVVAELRVAQALVLAAGEVEEHEEIQPAALVKPLLDDAQRLRDVALDDAWGGSSKAGCGGAEWGGAARHGAEMGQKREGEKVRWCDCDALPVNGPRR